MFSLPASDTPSLRDLAFALSALVVRALRLSYAVRG